MKPPSPPQRKSDPHYRPSDRHVEMMKGSRPLPQFFKLAAGVFFRRIAMTAGTAPPSGDASVWEAPPPVLLNTWKHHAAALRSRVCDAVAAGAAALDGLANNLVVIGSELMDLYRGALSPRAIGDGTLTRLRSDNHLSRDAYRAWVQASGGYRMLTLADDGSRWVLRLGDAARYVHVHPARRAPLTCRVKANVLKTAVMVLAYSGVHGGDPLDVALVNRVRAEYLGLTPLGRELAGDQGIGQTITLLRNPAGA
jgi:hypothetical protein